MKRTTTLFLLFILFATGGLAQNAQLRGTVIDINGEPLSGAAVYLPDLKKGAFANDKGVFSIAHIPAGEHRLWSFYVGYDTLKKTIVLKENQHLTPRLVLEEADILLEEVVITAQTVGKIQTKNVTLGKIAVSAKDINLLPSIGAPDLIQYLQVVPGIVFTGDQGGQVYIRGGTPIQNMTMLDGMIVYSPFHSIGLFSTFDPDYIRSVDVHSAGFPAKFGGRISSVIDIKTRNGNFNKIRGKLNLNPFSVNAMIEGPLKRARRLGSGSSFIVSYRQNYIDQTSTALYPHIDDTLGLPYNFTDLYGKLTFSDGINFANIFGFYNTDNVNYGTTAADIGWDAAGGGANFMLLPQGAGAIIQANFAWSRYDVGLNTPSELFPRKSSISGFNGGLDVSYIVNSIDEISAGIIFLGFSTDYQFTNSLGFITRSAASNSELAIYADYKKVFQTNAFYQSGPDSLWDLVVLEPSVRVHYYNDQAHVALEPRLRLKVNLPRISFSAATGLYTQNLMSAASDRDVVNFFQGILSAPSSLANRRKGHNLQTSFHFVAGMELEIAPNLATSIEGWMKDFTQLTNINRDKLFPEDPNFITETGLARGIDLMLKYQTPEWYLYGTYGLARVTRNDLIREYPTVFDRRHNVNLVGSYRFKRFTYREDEEGRKRAPKFKGHAWELSARWSLGSGFPFTQTQGYFERLDFRDNGAQTDVSTQNGQLGLLLADELNGGRLPYYHRMDVSAKRRWLIRNDWLIEANLTLVNTYDRQNIFYFDRVRFRPIYQLPILPSLGVTIKY